MTQSDFGTIDPNTKNGTELATDLNSFRDAQNTLHRGASVPGYKQGGLMWIDDSGDPTWIIKLFDGTDDLTLFTLDVAANTVALSFDTIALTDAGTLTSLSVIRSGNPPTVNMVFFEDTDAANNFSNVEIKAARPGFIFRDSTATTDDFRLGADGNLFKISIDGNQNDVRDAAGHFDDFPNAFVIDGATGFIGLSRAPTVAFDLGGTVSGGDVRSLVENTSNTASATASFELKVGGTTAKDPQLFFTIPSGSSWVMGADNSASDKFTLSLGSALGTSNALTFDASLNAVFGGTLTVKSNVDATIILGRTKIGSPVTDRMYIAHFDFLTNINYALQQTNTGETIVNAGSGQTLFLAIANVGQFAISKSGSETLARAFDEQIGGVVRLSVQNDDGTNVLSDATLRIKTDALGGDPYLHWTDGTQQYVMGIDNSDSDKLVISRGSGIGSDNVLEITTAGAATFKNALTVDGTLASGALTVTGAAIITTIITAGSASTVLTTAAGLLRHQAIDPSIAGAGISVVSGVLSADTQVPDWASPGTIGSTAANTGKFTNLESTGLATLDTAEIGQEAWTAPTLLNSWVNFGGSDQVCQFRKNSLGQVEIRGTVKDGDILTVFFTLPSGYRPANNLYFSTVSTIALNNGGTVKISSDGNVLQMGGNTTSASFDGIIFAV